MVVTSATMLLERIRDITEDDALPELWRVLLVRELFTAPNTQLKGA